MASGENGERNPFYGTGWDPIGSLNQSGHFGMDPHYSTVLENQVMGGDLAHFPSDPGLISEMLPKISTFGSEMVNSFGGHSNFAQNLDEGVFGGSPNGKRKRKALAKSAEEEQQQDTCELSKDDNENIEAKDTKNGVEVPSKENYIHVRAKRGQATNSHSLAERVRRERISERMRLLQELVPGCNKITGKAVMLDEIINYVQSLQQQVEFLSMKLATVNPEMNVDLQRILSSKDILQSRGINNTTTPGNGLAFGSSQPFPGYPHGAFSGPLSTTTPFPPFANNIWNNNEFQNMLQVRFDSDQPVSTLGPNGMSKVGGIE